MKLISGPYRYGGWRLHICFIMICYDLHNFSCSCKEYRVEENSMTMMFGNFDMT